MAQGIPCPSPDHLVDLWLRLDPEPRALFTDLLRELARGADLVEEERVSTADALDLYRRDREAALDLLIEGRR